MTTAVSPAHATQPAATRRAEPVVVFEGVSKTFTNGSGADFTALNNISLTVDSGDIYGLVGYSGAGKSTLLRTVNALERPSSGRVLVHGVDMTALQGSALYRARQNIGMIFQQFNLLNSRNVYKNIAYPLKLTGWSKDAILDRVEELLDFVGLTDKALQYPSRLSGGQKQRVAIARALATSPDILICDEATSALDPQTTGEVLELLQRVNTEFGVTILLVTHEMEVIREIANKVAVMEHGNVVEHGSTYDLFSAPKTEVARKFVSSVLHNLPDAGVLQRIRQVHHGRLVQVLMANRTSNDPFLTSTARAHNVDLNVVYGGIHEVQSRLFGSMTVELLGRDSDIDAAIAHLRENTTVEEYPNA